MTRYLLPLAFVAILLFAGQSAFAGHHGHNGYGGYHHHHQAFYPGAMGGFGFPGAYGRRYGIGYGAGYGLASPFYGGLGDGYSSIAPSVYGYPQSYFANPGYGQWGGFEPGF